MRELTNGHELNDRMDRRDVEPGDRLRQGQPRLHSTATPSGWRSGCKAMGHAELRERLRRSRCSAQHARSAAAVAASRSRIFVNSMSDLFHEDVPARLHPARVRRDAAGATGTSSRSSRSGRAACRNWPRVSHGRRNIWMGVSVENHRIHVSASTHLRGTRAPREVPLARAAARPASRISTWRGIDWVIVGGESGPRARPMQPGVGHGHPRPVPRPQASPFFFKQWGGVYKSRTGRDLEGRTWDEMPDSRENTTSRRWPLHPVEASAT